MKHLISNVLRAPARLCLHTFRFAIVGCHPAIVAAATIADLLLFLAATSAKASHGNLALMVLPLLVSFVFIGAYLVRDMRFMVWFLGLDDGEIMNHEFMAAEIQSRTDTIAAIRIFILSTAAAGFALAVFLGIVAVVIAVVNATPAEVAQVAGGGIILALGLSCLLRRRAPGVVR